MESIKSRLENAVKAKKSIQSASDGKKVILLKKIASALLGNSTRILAENKKDLDRMPEQDTKRDRLLLTEERIRELAGGMEAVSAFPDPAGQILSEKTLENGLLVRKISVPLGVVGVIYESRPNVTMDIAALCIRSGNACLLRGGSDALHSNTILVKLIQAVLKEQDLDENIVQLLPVDRELLPEMLTAEKMLDIIIPRGSQQLIEYVRENSRVPVIETGAGVCHTYVERSADLEKAAAVVVNAKVSRPSVCNALDTVVIDRQVAPDFLAFAAPGLQEHQVEIFADKEAYELLNRLGYPYLQEAAPAHFGKEYLSFKCSVKIVDNTGEALEHIARYSSKHSEAILAEDPLAVEQFLNEVDAAAVYANASTRFTDGGVFGLGGEIGISTQKLHARGPFGLEKLVTEKWIVRGDGQIR